MKIGLGVVGWILISMFLFAIFPGVSNSSTTGILMDCVGAPLLSGIALGVIAIVIEHIGNRIKHPATKIEAMLSLYQLELQKYEQIVLPRWKEAMTRWTAMYYCRRCDGAYVPGEDIKPQTPDRTIDLCYHGTEIASKM